MEDDTLKILASTYTNSAFKSNVYIPGTTSFTEYMINSFKVMVNPNPAKESCNIRLDLNTSGSVKITVFNSIGKVIKTLENGYFGSGKYDYFFSEKPGVYFIKTEVSGKVVTNKFIIL